MDTIMADKMNKVEKVAKVLEGEVVSNKMDKTIVVNVTRRVKHPLLGKIVRHAKKYKAHDVKGIAKVGDWVEIRECRPLSKTKHMELVKVVRESA